MEITPWTNLTNFFFFFLFFFLFSSFTFVNICSMKTENFINKDEKNLKH